MKIKKDDEDKKDGDIHKLKEKQKRREYNVST